MVIEPVRVGIVVPSIAMENDHILVGVRAGTKEGLNQTISIWTIIHPWQIYSSGYKI